MTSGANTGNGQNVTPTWLKGLQVGQQIAQMGQTPQMPQSPMAARRPMGGMPPGIGGGAVPTGAVPGAGGMMPQAPQPIGSTMGANPMGGAQFSPGSGAPLSGPMGGGMMGQPTQGTSGINPALLRMLMQSRGS